MEPDSSMLSSALSLTGDKFSWNCREELDSHVACVKLFLEEHVKYGTKYSPGAGPPDDPCHTTRQLYMQCINQRKRNPISPQVAQAAIAPVKAPKTCEMELTMHGNCVACQLDRTQRLGEKYWTQGGEDKCAATRSNYIRCMVRHDAGETDRWGQGPKHLSRELESNVSHLHVNLGYK